MSSNGFDREQLQEANQLNDEISQAISSVNIGQQIDDDELNEQLEELMQQDLEDKMLETGSVPVDRLPTVANGERKSSMSQRRLIWC